MGKDDNLVIDVYKRQAAHHIEIAVAVRGQRLEALDIDLRFGMEPGKDAAGKQILFICLLYTST